jgi:RND family efflux transporter MFP subunit
MESNDRYKPQRPVVNILMRIVICIVILGLGVLGMTQLASLKKPPAEVAVTERPVRVHARTVHPEDVPVFITGYGEAKTITEVVIAPEISGQVVAKHPRLHTGEIINEGETLFKIDPRNYQAACDEARASVAQLVSSVDRLKKQYTIDRERYKTLLRNQELSRAEFSRLQRLYENDKVGTRSGVENAEKGYNTAMDQADQMKRAIELYPIQIKETQSSLASARARMDLARANLDRCAMKAPFSGRIKAVSLEKGQFVSPGQQVLTLADDSTLEIRVPLDSRDARQWLQFQKTPTTAGMAWFADLKKVPCEIRWTENKAGHTWVGKLHRVVKFDQKTRTLTVAVRIDSDHLTAQVDSRLPLVEGMFCSVRIPGKTLAGVFRLPRQAVSFEKTIHVVVDNRLRTRPVTVVRIDGENTYVSEGLRAGDTVITTRLVDPLEDTLVEIIAVQGEKSS